MTFVNCGLQPDTSPTAPTELSWAGSFVMDLLLLLYKPIGLNQAPSSAVDATRLDLISSSH